jgi:hypothetical protein
MEINKMADTVAVVPIKNEVITFAVVAKLDASGKPVSASITSSEKKIAELEKPDYSGDETIAFKQPVISARLGSLDGLAELIPDPEVQLDIFNKGLGSKFNQKVRTTLTELDEAGNFVFQPTETPFDATSLLREAAQRTSMSDYDKAIKTISNLPPDMVAQILAQLSSLQQPAAAQ